MTTRLLPPSEWARLKGTLLDPAWRSFSVSDKILVVEDGDQIVACVSLTQQWHLDGLWVHEAYRQRVSVGRRLLHVVRDLCRALHIGEVLMMARTDQNAQMCRKLGPSLHLDCDHFAVLMETDGRPSLWQNGVH